jgi:polysaccharide export outer membrane protein
MNGKQYKSVLLSFVLIISIVSLTGIYSCKNYKSLTYFGDESDAEAKLYHQIDKPQDYVIKKNDNLYISIQSLNPELNAIYNPAVPSNTTGLGGSGGTTTNYGQPSSQYLNGYMVNKEGFVELPIIGDILIDGLTLSEAESKIKLTATEYIKEPTVKVKLLSFKVTVLGEVVRPGIYYNYNVSFTILDAISMANGNTDFSNISKVKVLRQSTAGIISYKLNLQDYEFLSSEAFYLQPDDVIYIQPSKYKNVPLKQPIWVLILSSATTVILIASYITTFGN